MRYLALILFATGCAAPWQTARMTIHSALASVTATHEIIGPELGEEVDEAFEIAETALAGGVEIVDLWTRTARCPDGWREWVNLAIESTRLILSLIQSTGVEVPSLILVGITATMHILELLL